MKKYCTAFSYARIILIVFCLIASSDVFAEQWGPLITTNWHQSNHFNNFCPLTTSSGSNRCVVGCVSTATSQIVNYWRYPTSISFDASDAYTSNGNAGTIAIDGDASVRSFPTFGQLTNALSSINYDQYPDEEAYLCFGTGVKFEMSYGTVSGAFMGQSTSILKDQFSYGSAQRDWGGDAWNDQRDRVVENIKNGWPVLLGVSRPDPSSQWNRFGHAVIVDGYSDTDGQFHVNLGWGGASDGWYALPIVDTRLYGGSRLYDRIDSVVYDISPYKGWWQHGSDARNTFSTVYAAPTTNPPADKWQVTCPSDYYFKGLIVGAGNRTYASCTVRFAGGNDHPSIWVIDQYGVKEKEIVIQQENGGITYPAQNSRGEIFVASDAGGVYRLDPETGSMAKIFTEPDGEQFFYPVKVDDDDYIYIATFYKLYSLSRTGTVRWTLSLPNNVWFLYRLPAIDSSRDRVYLGYYNFDTDIPYLASIDRNTGAIKHTKSFPAVTMISRSTGIPSVGVDGTVYVGSGTRLYALAPDTLSQKWSSQVFRSYITKAPAINRDNSAIYIPYWKERSGNWYLTFGALDPTDGSVKWEIERLSTDDYDNFGQPYIANNSVVVFPFLMENGLDPDTQEMCAYRDAGDHAELLWKKNFSTSGGEIAFGPGGTFYTWAQSGYGHTLWAVSEGDVGDPDGAGMGFTNNAAPFMPSNPTPADGTQNVNSSVTLSWSCSDPENNTLKYSVFVRGSGEDMIPVATDITSTSYSLSQLKAGTGYAWKIIVTDGQAVNDGPTWVFATLAATHHSSDTDANCVISISEIVSYINKWAAGEVTISDVVKAINLWAAGHYYWNPVDEKFKPGYPP